LEFYYSVTSKGGQLRNEITPPTTAQLTEPPSVGLSMVQTRAAAALTSEIWSKYAAVECEDSGEAYRDALAAAELASIVLRIELAAVEKAWAEEHASLLDQLARKDETIWHLAQHSQHFNLKASGAMVLTPPKRKVARQTYTVARPAWNEGHAGGRKAFGSKPPTKGKLAVNKHFIHAGGKGGVPMCDAKAGMKGGLPVCEASVLQGAAKPSVLKTPVTKTPVTKTPTTKTPVGLKSLKKAQGGVKRKAPMRAVPLVAAAGA
jgi:hypothetical protein